MCIASLHWRIPKLTCANTPSSLVWAGVINRSQEVYRENKRRNTEFLTNNQCLVSVFLSSSYMPVFGLH